MSNLEHPRGRGPVDVWVLMGFKQALARVGGQGWGPETQTEKGVGMCQGLGVTGLFCETEGYKGSCTKGTPSNRWGGDPPCGRVCLDLVPAHNLNGRRARHWHRTQAAGHTEDNSRSDRDSGPGPGGLCWETGWNFGSRNVRPLLGSAAMPRSYRTTCLRGSQMAVVFSGGSIGSV
eukprot:750920-Hanusia_phi.AAC.5